MKAVIINRYGPPEVLQYRDVEKPPIKPDRLLVKVCATSVNPIDWKLRRGDLQLLSGFNFPLRLGSDLAGVVEAVGAKVTQFQPGDEIYTFVNPLGGGAYAEYVAVPESSAALKPKNMTFEQAAAVPVAGLTALQALLNLGQVRPGEKVLIDGASGGVGTFAVQVAKAMSTEVTGVCSTKNVEFVQSLGADSVIDYTQQDFTQLGTQYDIIFDAVAKRSFSDCQKVRNPEGIYISTRPSPELFTQMLRTLFVPGKKAKLVLAQARARDLSALRDLIEAGKVRSVIDRTYPLSEVAAAHAYSETGKAVGKIVLTVVEDK